VDPQLQMATRERGHAPVGMRGTRARPADAPTEASVQHARPLRRLDCADLQMQTTPCTTKDPSRGNDRKTLRTSGIRNARRSVRPSPLRLKSCTEAGATALASGLVRDLFGYTTPIRSRQLKLGR